MRAIASCTDGEITPPVGLLGETSTSMRERGVIRASISAGSTSKFCSAYVGTGTTLPWASPTAIS
jgi:hypothetical protein